MVKVKIVFVCLGNICRSPMAEGVFNHLVAGAGLAGKIESDSAGTGAYHIGSQPDQRTLDVAKEHSVSINHRARQISKQDFEDFDYIVAMDLANKNNILSLAAGNSDNAKKVLLMRDFENAGLGLEVPDPYYDGKEMFEEVYQILLRSNQGFLDWLLKQHQVV